MLIYYVCIYINLARLVREKLQNTYIIGGDVMKIEWNAMSAEHEKGNILFEKCDISQYLYTSNLYKNLSKQEKAKYRSMDCYVEQITGIEFSAPKLKYIRLMQEVELRINSNTAPEILRIDPVLDKRTIRDLLSSLENEDYIKRLYKNKKLNVISGLNTTEASILLDCMKQGRIMLDAGRKADMLAKPLIDFYAATAYAYALIVMNSPMHKSIKTLKGSHGHTYNHEKSSIDFGGEIPSGTFLDMLCAFPVSHINSDNLKLNYSVVDSIDYIQTHSISLSLTALLSMVPELASYYNRFDTEHKLVHKLDIDTSIVNSEIIYNFYIGDGITKADIEKLKRSFKTDQIKDNQGSFIVNVEAEQLQYIMPIIYKDVKGNLWYIESPIDGIYIPEICLHFLLISALCNIMRYSPNEWSAILNNKISSAYSLLIRRYIELFETKCPMLVISHLTNYSLNMMK